MGTVKKPNWRPSGISHEHHGQTQLETSRTFGDLQGSPMSTHGDCGETQLETSRIFMDLQGLPVGTVEIVEKPNWRPRRPWGPPVSTKDTPESSGISPPVSTEDTPEASGSEGTEGTPEARPGHPHLSPGLLQVFQDTRWGGRPWKAWRPPQDAADTPGTPPGYPNPTTPAVAGPPGAVPPPHLIQVCPGAEWGLHGAGGGQGGGLCSLSPPFHVFP
ncbi:uncharacterized protein LOC113960956 [Neopelma chrysocephalum]|uniref:uncharacterized protein LOC113960956 n=1 Tax=Neopelma chrysocephalum TaxID=114329 RepID=UPI000FCD2CA6|nr:uncharacterized protein LOC113960956 [Neopelma chrysocephalum]